MTFLPEQYERVARDRAACIRRLRKGKEATYHERKHAKVIRDRLNHGDLTTPAQVEFTELVEAIPNPRREN